MVRGRAAAAAHDGDAQVEQLRYACGNLKEQTDALFKTLTPREERVIRMPFGVGDGSTSGSRDGMIRVGQLDGSPPHLFVGH